VCKKAKHGKIAHFEHRKLQKIEYDERPAAEIERGLVASFRQANAAAVARR
jgi:hypothetical protein